MTQEATAASHDTDTDDVYDSIDYSPLIGAALRIIAVVLLIGYLATLGEGMYGKHQRYTLLHRLAYDCEHDGGVPSMDQSLDGRMICGHFVAPKEVAEANAITAKANAEAQAKTK